MSQPPLALDAPTFLKEFSAQFEQPIVRAWTWNEDADESGLVYSWDIVLPDPMEGQRTHASASIDLQQTQLTLSISERTLRSPAEELETGRPDQYDSVLTFVALVQFEDQTLSLDSEPREYNREEIAELIEQFNLLVAL